MARLRQHWQIGLALGFAASVLVLLWSRTTLGGAGDVVIAFPTSFSSLDGSGQDSDNTANGVFTVHGDLTITNGGAITCNDDLPLAPNGDACPIRLNVAGSLTIENGGSVLAENRRSGGDGGNIFLNVGGDLSLQAAGGGLRGGIISASKLSGAGDTGVGGDATIHVAGDVAVGAGAQILANASGEAGAIEVTGRTVEIAGVVSSNGSSTIGRGGPISIASSCDLTVEDSGVISSRGQGPGADLVHLQGCIVTIYGLVESTGPGHQNAAGKNLCNDPPRPGHPPNSTACVEVWAGAVLTIDSMPPHNGEVNTDTALSGGTSGRGWSEFFANEDISVSGDISGHFAVHANQPTLTNGHGGQIILRSTWGAIHASGFALQADAAPPGGHGGYVELKSGREIALYEASITARGDFNQAGGFGTGGRIVMSAGGPLSWPSGLGDFRPTGTDVGIQERGSIFLSACFMLSANPSFPSLGTPTSPVASSIFETSLCLQPQYPPDYTHLPPQSCCGRPTPPPTATPNIDTPPTPNIRIIRFSQSTPTPTPTPTAIARRQGVDRGP